MEKINKPCKYFVSGQECKFKEKCKFQHIKNKKPKNTVDFEPLKRNVDMKIVVDTTNNFLKKNMNDLDIVLATNLFKEFKEYEIYNKLVEEINTCGIDLNILLKHWHGNNKGLSGTHYIADDSLKWKENCNMFNYVVNKVVNFFDMEPKTTRFNWYRSGDEWKPLHHDASKVKPHIAKTQNITVAVSFGQSRDIILQHANKQDIYISIESNDGECYAFSHTINCLWKHGVHIASDIERKKIDGRISIIIWGYKKDLNCNNSN